MTKLRKTYRSRMSFDAAEIAAVGFCLELAKTGIQIGQPALTAEQKAVMNLGLFGSNSDSNKFYENIKSALDVAPKPEDFVEVPFRLLSATIVGGGSWKATDFSDAEALKASHKKLENKPVYKNHDFDSIDNWVGMVKETKWTEGFMQGSMLVPPGIDGVLAIDAKTSPKEARGLLMKAIGSNSVTVEFDWSPSHEYKTQEEFFYALGTIHADGKMVTRKVTAVHDYHETSLVFLGADPFAKMIDKDGNLRNIHTSAVVEYSKATDAEKQAYEKGKTIQVGFSLDSGVISYAIAGLAKDYKTTTPPPAPTLEPKKQISMNKFLALMLATFPELAGLSLTEENDEKFTAAFDKFVKDSANKESLAKAGVLDELVDKVPVLSFVAPEKEGDAETQKEEKVKVTLTSDKVELSEKLSEGFVFVKKADLTSLTEKVKGLSVAAAFGNKQIETQRAECVRLYKVTQAKPDEAVISLINEAKPEALPGLLAQYGGSAISKFCGTCNKCKSTDISFRSSTPDPEEKPLGELVPTKVGKSFDDLHAEKDFGSMSAGRIN